MTFCNSFGKSKLAHKNNKKNSTFRCDKTINKMRNETKRSRAKIKFAEAIEQHIDPRRAFYRNYYYFLFDCFCLAACLSIGRPYTHTYTQLVSHLLYRSEFYFPFIYFLCSFVFGARVSLVPLRKTAFHLFSLFSSGFR